MPEPKTIETSAGLVEFGSDGIARVRYVDGSDVDLSITLDLHRAFAGALAPGEKCPVLIDLSTVRSFSRSAREASTGDLISRSVSAVAVLQHNPVAAAIYNWTVRLHRPPFPTRLFSNELAALSWLRSYQTERDVLGRIQ